MTTHFSLRLHKAVVRNTNVLMRQERAPGVRLAGAVPLLANAPVPYLDSSGFFFSLLS